jgi:PEGA domain
LRSQGRSAFLALALMTTLSLSSTRAHADASPEAVAKADQLKDQGNQAMDQLRYQQALALYAEAYGLTQDPALLFNKGRALEALGEFPAALDAQEEFASKASPQLLAKVPGHEKLVADLRARVATLDLKVGVDKAEVRIGDRIVGVTGGGVPFKVNAGKVKIHIAKEGYFPYERELTLPGGQITVLDVALESKSTRGVLVVRSPITGAFVVQDGVALGVVPTESVVTPGTHKLHLTHEGFNPADTTAVVIAGERREVDVSLEAREPLYKKWWFWTGIGVVVAGGVVLTYALLTERSPDRGTINPGQVPTSLIRF